jgi:hypothetical protein
MQQCALGVGSEGPIFQRREEPSERPKIMSIHPFRPLRSAEVPPVEPYFSADPVTLPAPRLRRLTALEQMYAYWGSDRD